MIVNRVNIPKLLRENDAAYLSHVEFLVKSIDENAELTVIQKLGAIGFHILPSDAKLKPFLIKGIRKSHYKLDLKIDFSKSVNALNTISFWTCFEE